MSKFKEGDEVQISYRSVFREQGYQGGEKMRGVINRLDSNHWWRVTWDNGDTNTYRDEDLEPYDTTTSLTTSYGFHIGERVIVCENGFGFAKSDVGKEFIIIEFGDYGGDPGVKLRDVKTNTIHPNFNFNDFVGIKSIKKIETTSTSEPEENITFTVNGRTYNYTLCSTYYSYSVSSNDVIFNELGVDKDLFCSKVYGYEALDGSWPEWRDGDNEAPIKIVKAIREKIKQMESQTEPQRKFKVGDTVVGNSKATDRYCVTGQGWRGKVTEVYSDYFKAQGQGNGGVLSTFDLYYEYFDHTTKPESIDIEALLEEANRRYPIGTMYKELNDEGKATGALREASEGANWVVRGESIEVGYGYVYAKGKWAEVVSDKETILEEARRRYPVGTEYHPINSDGTKFRSFDRELATYECRWVDSGLGIDCGIGYVYANGKWAEIVGETKYVVTQRTLSYPAETATFGTTKELPYTQTPIIINKKEKKQKIKVI